MPRGIKKIGTRVNDDIIKIDVINNDMIDADWSRNKIAENDIQIKPIDEPISVNEPEELPKPVVTSKTFSLDTEKYKKLDDAKFNGISNNDLLSVLMYRGLETQNPSLFGGAKKLYCRINFIEDLVDKQDKPLNKPYKPYKKFNKPDNIYDKKYHKKTNVNENHNQQNDF
jgi:hypothetical protein